MRGWSVTENTENVQMRELLEFLSRRVRRLRAARGMTRKNLSRHSRVSERYLAQLESGKANPSVDILVRVADSLGVPFAQLLSDPEQSAQTRYAPLWQMLRDLTLGQQQEAYKLLSGVFGGNERRGVALIGLRGAGKSSLGIELARSYGVDFVRLSDVIEDRGGMKVSELISLVGQKAYRRIEGEAIEEIVGRRSAVVLEVGGSIVSESRTFERLLTSFYTVWIKAAPEEHMNRVIEQGDMRPMAGNEQAMTDLRRILAEREDQYRRADYVLDTSGRLFDECLEELINACNSVLGDSEKVFASRAYT